MNNLKSLTLITCAAVAGILGSGAMAPAQAFTVYLGEDPGAASGANPISNSIAAETNFRSRLSSFSADGFESSPLGLRTTPLGIPGINATITGTADAANPNVEKNSVISGISTAFSNYAISGSKSYAFDFFEGSGSDTTRSTRTLTIDFAAPVAAFGFYGTDFGDDSGAFTLELDNGMTLALNNSINPANDGSALYYGFVADNASEQFSRVTFRSSSSVEVIGLDNLTVATLGQLKVATTATAVPEPFTIIGTLIGGTAAFRLKKKLK